MTPIVIAFTPNYFVPAATLVHSVLGSSNGRFEFICLLQENLPDLQKKLLEDMAGTRAVFKYLTVDCLPKDVYIDQRYGAAAEFRLLLPELLPELDKVIYVDCDIIVRNDLEKLYLDADLGENLLACVYEAPVENQAAGWAALGCDPEKYFNSGFLVMNLAGMRLDGTSSKLISTLQHGSYEFPDQDALNIVCKGRTLPLPPYHNGIRTYWLPQYRSDFLKLYSDADWNDLQAHGTVHYTGAKPWNRFTVRFDAWWEEYHSLPSAIRAQWRPCIGVRLLGSIYLTKVGRFLIDSARSFGRKLKGTI